MEIKTKALISKRLYIWIEIEPHALVTSKVFDSAANIVIKIGPKTGWKLFACWKLKKVFPNQICTISHMILVMCQWLEPGGEVSD
jgi:hypothetical protein